MKEFILDLDRQRKLIYDFDAWDAIGEHFNQGNSDDFDMSKLNITYRDLPFLVYAGLKWDDVELTPEKTKELLNAAIREGKYDILKIMELVIEAIFTQAGIKKQELKIEAEAEPKNLIAAEAATDLQSES